MLFEPFLRQTDIVDYKGAVCSQKKIKGLNQDINHFRKTDLPAIRPTDGHESS